MKRAHAEQHIATLRAEVIALAGEPYRPEFDANFICAVDNLILAAQSRD